MGDSVALHYISSSNFILFHLLLEPKQKTPFAIEVEKWQSIFVHFINCTSSAAEGYEEQLLAMLQVGNRVACLQKHRKKSVHIAKNRTLLLCYNFSRSITSRSMKIPAISFGRLSERARKISLVSMTNREPRAFWHGQFA
jgi:hypothetical protein